MLSVGVCGNFGGRRKEGGARARLSGRRLVGAVSAAALNQGVRAPTPTPSTWRRFAVQTPVIEYTFSLSKQPVVTDAGDEGYAVSGCWCTDSVIAG